MQKNFTGFADVPYALMDGVDILTTDKPDVKLDLMRIDSSMELGLRKTTKYHGNIWVKSEIFHFDITHIRGLDPEFPFELYGLTLELFETAVWYRQFLDSLGNMLRKLNQKRRGQYDPAWTVTGSERDRVLKVMLNLRTFKSQDIATSFTVLLKEATAVSNIARQLAVTHEQSIKRAGEILEQELLAR